MVVSSFPLDFIEWPRRWSHTSSSFQGALANFTLATHKAAWTFMVVRDGTIDKFSIRLSTITTGDTLTGSIQTVATNGDDPTGTLLATGASGTVAVTGANAESWIEFTLGTPVPVTAGQVIAAVVANGSVPGVMTVARMSGSAPVPATEANVRNENFTTAWAAFTSSGCLFALSYQGVGYIPTYNGFAWAPGEFFAEESIVDASNPDERGNLFVCPCDMEVSGLWVCQGGTGDSRIRLYDSSDTVLAELTLDGPQSDEGSRNVFFDPVELEAGASYRMTSKATTATSTGLLGCIIQPALAAAHPGGANWTKTTRNNDTGGWTDTANRRYQMGLQISGIPSSGTSERAYSSIN